MRIFSALRRYWRDWRRGDSLDRDIADELRFHLEMIARDEVRNGAEPDDAAARARRRFGRVDAWQDECRQIRGIGSADMFRRDISSSIRALRHAPAFTATAFLTIVLATAIGSAGFSIVHSVLIAPLPYPQAERLVTAWQLTTRGERGQVAPANWVDWTRSSRTIEKLAAYSRWNFTIMGEPEAIRIEGAIVIGPFFDVLGVPAALGRTFTSTDHSGADAGVAIISDGLWRRRFGADPAIIGRDVVVGAGALRIVGVTPPGFAYPTTATEIWAPLAASPAILGDRSGEWLRTVGRLAPGSSVDEAAAELSGIAANLASAYPDVNRGESATVTTLHDEVVGDVAPVLLVLCAAVLALTLVASVNIAALQLARSDARRREFALRTALGATPARVLSQIVTESLVLGVGGGIAGLLLGVTLLRVAVAAAPADVPRLQEIVLHPASAFVSILVVVVTLVAAGWMSTRWSKTTDVRDDLAPGAQGQTATRGVVTRQAALVVLQVAFAVVLLVSGGLLVRSALALASVDPGFDTEVVSVRVALPRSQYRTDAEQIVFFSSIVERIGAQAGVERAGAVTDLPLVGNNVSFHVTVKGSESLPSNERPLAAVRAVTPGYLDTMRIPVLRGRGIDDGDLATALPVALVNRTFAAQQWNGEAVGRQLQISGDPRWWTIVGITDDVRQLDLREEEGPAIYIPLAQKQLAFLNWMTFVARGHTPGLAATMRAAVRSVDPTQPAFDARTMSQRLEASIATPRMAAAALTSLAITAAVLALIGVYGTLAFLVGRKTREIGVRMALGATPRDILRLVLGRGAATVGTGLVIGLAVSLVLTRSMQSVLFGVGATDPVTYVAAAVLFAAAAGVATYIPARRAAAVDPLRSIKFD